MNVIQKTMIIKIRKLIFMSQQLNILLVDDEKICLDIIRSSLHVFNYVNIAAELSNCTDLINTLQNNDIDLVILDIEMNGISGFDIAKHIRTNYPNIMIIFLTGHTDLALDGYEYQPIDFLIKPVNILRLEQALSKAKNIKYNLKKANDVQIGILTGKGLEIINVKDILYMEKSGRKVVITCKNNEKIYTNDSLQKLETIFTEHNFFRNHQSFLVSINEIKSMQVDEFKRTYTLHLKSTKDVLPLSRDKYDEIKQLLIKEGLKIY